MMKTPQMKNTSFNWREQSLLKVAKYVSFIVGAVILICVLIFIFFPDPFINAFFKDRITKAFKETYPAYSIKFSDMHYNFWKNRLGCDSLTLKTNDSTLTCSVASFSVSGIGWMKILMKKDYTSNILTSSVIDAQKIVLNFRQSQNELRFDMLHISVPDSEMVADSIKFYSLIDDEQFFAKNQFRQTRFRFNIPQIKIMGLNCLALLQGNIYSARNINIHDVFLDILVNMDKPYDMNSSNPQMLNEALSSMKEIVKVDSLKVINGRLNYRERFVVKAIPGVVKFDKVNVSISGIANNTAHPDTTIIHGEGLFMNSGTMKLFMAIPPTSTDFSLRYSGSLSTMDVTVLNSFIEPCEHKRIKSGILQSATYNINVNSGHANGTLRAAYKDLSIAVLNKNTGSENGIFDRVSSIFSKIFIIRGANMPDEKGLMKIGEIKYTRNPRDYFFNFLWFALRNGIADVIGLPQI
ncbi:MAG: hypothetical protein NTZ27_12285 [Ignavibacteriales bacterium]|nr:hypothetical protein [Ignavibacteriales bacterium]